jgi:hypothetical protein
MAKFYVQSGTLRAVVDSVDAGRAALWAVHRAMEQIAPLDETDSPENKADECRQNGLIALAETIRLSEVGFDDEDSMTVDTFEAYNEWYALVRAIDKLEKLL